jgi:hypothetical protein
MRDNVYVEGGTMKKANVSIGGTYRAKVSGSYTRVRITSESRYGGWDAINLATGRRIHVRTAARLSPIFKAKDDAELERLRAEAVAAVQSSIGPIAPGKQPCS